MLLRFYMTLWIFLAGLVSIANAQYIVAHRGASFDAPENTLAAFRLAWEQQADAIEGDFYLTRDQEIVCIHDKTTKRTAVDQPDRKVADSTLAELRQLEFGAWKDPKFRGEPIPTLQEVLAIVPEKKKIFVEIKCGPEILPVLQKQLEQSSLSADQIVLICFDAKVIREARERMPQFKANWLVGYKQEKGATEWLPAKPDVLKNLSSSPATGMGTHGNREVVDQAFANEVVALGRELHVWTINEEEEAKHFARLGALSITTDRPLAIRKALTAPTSK